MPEKKISVQELEALTAELAQVLVKHKAPLDVSVTALGHLAASLMNQQLLVQNKVEIAETFAKALKQGITIH